MIAVPMIVLMTQVGLNEPMPLWYPQFATWQESNKFSFYFSKKRRELENSGKYDPSNPDCVKLWNRIYMAHMVYGYIAIMQDQQSQEKNRIRARMLLINRIGIINFRHGNVPLIGPDGYPTPFTYPRGEHEKGERALADEVVPRFRD